MAYGVPCLRTETARDCHGKIGFPVYDSLKAFLKHMAAPYFRIFAIGLCQFGEIIFLDYSDFTFWHVNTSHSSFLLACIWSYKKQIICQLSKYRLQPNLLGGREKGRVWFILSWCILWVFRKWKYGLKNETQEYRRHAVHRDMNMVWLPERQSVKVYFGSWKKNYYLVK